MPSTVGYTSARFTQDVAAGITVGVLLIPQSMSYAILAGLPPIYGMYACTVPLFVYAAFASSTQLQIGTVATTSILLQSAVSSFNPTDPDDFIRIAIALSFVVGCVQVFMGLARFGFLASLLSWPVMSGFTSASACIIGVSQFKYFFGIPSSGSGFFEKLLDVAVGLPGLHVPTTLLSLFTLLCLMAAKSKLRLPKWFPMQLLLIIATTALSYMVDLESHGVAIVGPVPAGFPSAVVPFQSLSEFVSMIPSAVVISIVSYVGSISLALVFAKEVKETVNANRELVALGLSCLVGSFFQGHVVTGSFSRTAMNRDMGATSGVSGIVTACLMVLSLLFLSPLFEFLPMSTLAVLIVTSLQSLIKVNDAKRFWQVNRQDFYQLAGTFLAVLALGIDVGIMASISLSCAFLVYRSFTPYLAQLGRVPGSHVFADRVTHDNAYNVEGATVVRHGGELHFGNKSILESRLEALLVQAQAAEPQSEGGSVVTSRFNSIRGVVLDGSCMPAIDVSGCQMLADVMDNYQQSGVGFLFAGMHSSVMQTLDRYLEACPWVKRKAQQHGPPSPTAASVAFVSPQTGMKYFLSVEGALASIGASALSPTSSA